MATTPATNLVDELRRAGVSSALTPDDPRFAETLCGFNLALTHRPDVVVVPGSVEEVAGVLRIAARHDQTIHVLGLGHGVLASIEGGIAVSTRGLAHVAVDPAAGTARVAAGTTWAEVLDAATPYGLAPLCGSAPHVGVIGYLLGGGVGPVARTYGFAADHVRSLTVVTADGSVVRVDAANEPELFWALRGGKSGLGLVVAATIDLFPLASVVAGGLYFAAADAHSVLRTFATWAAGLPETATTSIALLRLPPLPELPDPLRGQFVVHLRFASTEAGERVQELLRPVRAIARPVLDTVAEIPYAQIGSVHADPVHPMPVTEGGVLLRSFDEEAAERLLDAVGPSATVPLAAVEIRLLGGAMARPPAVPNAVGGRNAAYSLHLVSAPVPELHPPARAVIAGVFDALQPWRCTGSQVNFFGSANDPGTWEDCWPREVAERLRTIRAAVDPQGRFAGAPPRSPGPATIASPQLS